MLAAAYIGVILMEMESYKCFRTFYIAKIDTNLIQIELQAHGVLDFLIQNEMLQSY